MVLLTHEDSSTHQSIYSPAAVFLRNERHVASIFLAYASIPPPGPNTPSNSRPGTAASEGDTRAEELASQMVLYLPGMYELARDCDFGTRCDFTDREIWNIFSAVQANTRDELQTTKEEVEAKSKGGFSSGSGTSSSASSAGNNPFAFGGKVQQSVGGEIVFTEFQEVLGALSVLNNPNPYVPLHSKYEEFLHMEVYPFAKTSAQRPTSSTSSARAPSRPGSSVARQKAPAVTAPGKEEKGEEGRGG